MENQFYRQKVDPAKLPGQLAQKWPIEVLDEGFVPFPKKLLRCFHRILEGPDAGKELAVILAVVDFKFWGRYRAPKLAFLAFLAGLEETEFSAALNRLKQKALVEVEGGPDALNVKLDGLLRAIETQTRE